MRTTARDSVGGPVSGLVSRPSLAESVRSASDRPPTSPTASSILKAMPEEKPVAIANGVSVSIHLAEPVLFLQGFEQGDTHSRSTAMLRGNLHLRVSKGAKIKAVTLKFRGRAVTKWPEGIPPKKSEYEEVNNIMNHTWPFFNAQFPTAETGTGADHVSLRNHHSSLQGLKSRVSSESSPTSSSFNLSPKDARKLSLQVNQSRSFGKGESATGGPTVAQKGYRTFSPGDYIYNFELPIDSHLPETIDVDLGNVKYELEAVVERAGAFRANLIGSKEVVLIRAPSEGSLEQVEPIAISRNWEDQLHYDIVISGKSFPLGSQVPIAFKLTPLAKVQCHRIKVFVTENIEYFCSNKRVHRMEPVRKVQLFEKRADAAPVSTYPGSTVRVISGGGVPYDQRAQAARGEDFSPQDPSNLLGSLDGEAAIGPTEMEFNVQLPSCGNMREKERGFRLHFDTTYQNIQVHHWIKIVMRLSKPDPNDSSKRRHFEISIDSPFHILSCRATQANTELPAYSSPAPEEGSQRLFECGCPGAMPMRRTTPPSFIPTPPEGNRNGTRNPNNRHSIAVTHGGSGLARPQAAHLSGPMQRPIHILRMPSFNPPEFADDDPPPPMETPPPRYDTIASPTSGLADYFSRLSDAYDDESEGSGDSGEGEADLSVGVRARLARSRSRVDVPLTPGSRVNRSMDEPRTWGVVS
ncbi:hypothetical protein BDY21DRAFT_122868 [Lineolata rhizophorae]|uniref:Arrestin C-terminal-like domain-containing protein n=1 Tax=Lineolata rhizophorae TaxID=578093 RepID=A0A6A6NQ35_9PEZI|nr:hypothetical protein BDY21DRAFT_122868 [Lineolata rhizophorae]